MAGEGQCGQAIGQLVLLPDPELKHARAPSGDGEAAARRGAEPSPAALQTARSGHHRAV